ncbi:hypothetical protein D3C84_222040 [compost metagenome]
MVRLLQPVECGAAGQSVAAGGDAGALRRTSRAWRQSGGQRAATGESPVSLARAQGVRGDELVRTGVRLRLRHSAAATDRLVLAARPFRSGRALRGADPAHLVFGRHGGADYRQCCAVVGVCPAAGADAGDQLWCWSGQPGLRLAGFGVGRVDHAGVQLFGSRAGDSTLRLARRRGQTAAAWQSGGVADGLSGAFYCGGVRAVGKQSGAYTALFARSST